MPHITSPSTIEPAWATDVSEADTEPNPRMQRHAPDTGWRDPDGRRASPCLHNPKLRELTGISPRIDGMAAARRPASANCSAACS